MSTALLSRRFSLEYSRTISNLLCNSTSLRFMGGGPRTFPGGLNKWQWKRLHEKKAREKEKKLLSQEKQLYEARIRSQIRSKLAGKSDSPAGSTQFGPITAQDQVRLLADRFMKEGAEDLWNEDDGPIGTVPSRVSNRRVRDSGFDSGKFVPNRSNSDNLADKGSDSVTGLRNFLPNRSNLANLPDHSGGSAIDLRKNVSNRRNLADNAGTSWTPLDSFRRYGNISFCRDYSVVAEKKLKIRSKFRANRCSSSDDDDGEFVPNGSKSKFSKFSLEDNLLKPSGSKSKGLGIEGKWNLRWPRFNLYESEQEDSGSTNSRGRTDLKKVASRAALGSYDLKPKRRPLQRVEEDNDSSHRVLSIRDELKMVDLSRNAVMGHQEKEESYLSKKRFDECRISPLTIKALSSAGYVQMTMVQEGSLPVCLEGKDVLVKAKTGTGKSAAFLLPAIEAVLNASNSSVNQRLPPILVLVLCPTRELASQIAAEANVLLKHHAGIGVQTLIGGTRFKDDQKRLESGPCQIIVATPGRLLDHIENKSGFSVRLMGLKVLILDEADHLLDLGFRKDIEKIVDCVPRQRQSLLFSATIPKEVRRISQLVLKRDHVFIDTVGLGGLETHTKVLQSYLAASHEIHFEIVLSILKEHIVQIVDYKVIVFCITSMVTSLLYLLLREVKMNVREMHSRKSQLYRTHISDEFRESKRLILVTSDVSARGMNYPDVTLVVQVGIPSDREQYIHRLGRTGREGKDGEGILLLAPWEEYFLDEVKDLPIQKSPLPRLDPDIKAKVETSLAKIDTSTKEAAYHSWLGYYNSIREIGRDKTMLVELANQFCNSIGLQKPPAIFRKTASKMGLRDIPGIRIRK